MMMMAFSLDIYVQSTLQSALTGQDSLITKSLLDCLELDPSIYVRMQVFDALFTETAIYDNVFICDIVMLVCFIFSNSKT